MENNMMMYQETGKTLYNSDRFQFAVRNMYGNSIYQYRSINPNYIFIELDKKERPV